MIWEIFFGPAPIIWIQQTLGLGWPLPFRIFSLLGDTWGVIFAVGLARWLWGREAAYALVGIVLLEAGTNMLINQVVHIPRPSAPGIVKYEHVPLASFPSGHVFTATVLWGTLHALRLVPLLVPVLVAALVGISRLYLGVHYLGDVLGGVAFGILLVWGYIHLWPHIREWFSERSWTFFWGLALVALAGAIASFFVLGQNAVMWNTAGMVAGAAIGLPVEARFVRYAPGREASSRQLLKVVIGLSAIVPALLVDRLTGEPAFVVGAIATGLATLWAMLLCPALFARMESSRAHVQ